MGRHTKSLRYGQARLWIISLVSCKTLFCYELTGYLALVNMLDLANENSLPKRLLEMNGEEFRSWLHRVGQEGSVTG